MVWVQEGIYRVGSEDKHTNNAEGPSHEVQVSGFYIDKTEVINAQFMEFVNKTGYETMVERPLDWEELSSRYRWLHLSLMILSCNLAL